MKFNEFSLKKIRKIIVLTSVMFLLGKTGFIHAASDGQFKTKGYSVEAKDGSTVLISPSEGCGFKSSRTYFSMHGTWKFVGDSASLPCYGASIDHLAINPAGPKPVAEYLPLSRHTLIFATDTFKVFRTGLPDKNYFEVVTFNGSDGQKVYVKYPRDEPSSLLVNRRLNTKFELTYGVTLNRENLDPDRLKVVDKLIHTYALKIIGK